MIFLLEMEIAIQFRKNLFDVQLTASIVFAFFINVDGAISCNLYWNDGFGPISMRAYVIAESVKESRCF